jgi:hypothetical protein
VRAQPVRIQRRRSKGWRMPEGAVYVGRPSKWGNPFQIASAIQAGFAEDEATARVVAVTFFREWLRNPRHFFESPSTSHEVRSRFLNSLHELRGRDLACWCPLYDKDGNKVPCHADVLLELANREP